MPLAIPAVLLVLVAQTSAAQPAAEQAHERTYCVDALAGAADAATGQLCAGEELLRLSTTRGRDTVGRRRDLESAATAFRRSASSARSAATKIAALNQLALTYDAAHLDAPADQEQVLRELIDASPGDLEAIFRLASFQEQRGQIEAAEATLLDARHQQPEDEQPNRMLAQFYARRVTALHQRSQQAAPPSSNPGEPDANGVYRIGNALPPPARADLPRYPPDALAAGIRGNVVAEVVIDPSGQVTDARVVRSVPMLDEAALDAVRQWRFAPTVVNGQAVPVRMNVTINFAPPPPRR
jgi:protein TonB